MMTNPFFQEHAKHMAQRQAQALLHDPVRGTAATVVAHAVQLILDCVQYLQLPALAVEVAFGLHEQVERWAAWGLWARALDALLMLPNDAYPIDARIRLLHTRNHAACELGDYSTAATVAERALWLAEVHGDQTLLALSLHELAVAAYYGDELLVAQTYWMRAYQMMVVHLKPNVLGHIAMNLGLIAEHQGRLDDALHMFEQAYQYYQTDHNLFYLVKLQNNMANVYRAQGRREHAVEILRAAYATAQAIGAVYECGLITNTTGYVYLELEQYAAAHAAFLLAKRSFDQIGSLSGTALVLSNMAELYVTTAQWQPAAATLHEARELATLCHKPLLVAAVDVDDGRMLAAHGDDEQARRLWEQALAVQEAKGALHAAHHTRTLIDSSPRSRSR